MKKIFSAFVFSVFAFTVNAQDTGFSVGANMAIPSGEFSDNYSSSFGVDVNYMSTSDEKFNYGFATGYHSFLGKTILGVNTPSASFLPLAFAGRYETSEKVVIGVDIGYAIGMKPFGNKGGLYYKPMIVYDVGNNMFINLFFSVVRKEEGKFSNFGLGIMVKL